MLFQGVDLPGFTIKKHLILSGNALGFQQLLQAGNHWLSRHVEQVNRINVFPVPDGDTGTNMLLTLQAAVEATTCGVDPTLADIAAAAAEGALHGGRGNSGLILSQFLQGLADGLAGKQVFTAPDLASAINLGAEQAYRSVREPVEGTILTIARAAAEAAIYSAGECPGLTELMVRAVAAAKQAQSETPHLLPALAQAGVTDSGGLGLLLIFEGMLRFLDRKPDEASSVTEELVGGKVWYPSNGHDYGYDVQFMIEGTGLPVEQIQADLSRLGESSLIVGGTERVKVHLHTPNPARIVRRAERFGRVADLLIEDMTRQAHEFVHSKLDSRVYNDNSAIVTLITLVSGAGLVEIFRADSQIVGQVEALPTAIEQAPSAEVLILPTAATTLTAAQDVAAVARKSVAVVPTESIPQALSALLAFNPQLNLTTNTRRMVAAAQRVRTISLSPAAELDPDQSVIWQAALDGQPVGTGVDIEALGLATLSPVSAVDHDVVTVYFGAGGTQTQANRLALRIQALYPNLELDIVNGGQPQPYYIIALE